MRAMLFNNKHLIDTTRKVRRGSSEFHWAQHRGDLTDIQK